MAIMSFLYTVALLLRGVGPPAADHHVHIRSAAATENLARVLLAVGDKTPPQSEPVSAAKALAALDSAGVEQAAVLSVAYQFGFFLLQVADEEQKVIAENDYVSGEVSAHRDRLRGFCSLNPLKPYAIRELGRCSALPGMVGLKLHLANSGVDLTRADHRDALKAVFAEADRRNLAIVVHARMSLDGYPVEIVRRFVREILPAAPHVTVQVAHMAGWGGFDQVTDDALGVFVDAFKSGALPRDHFYFDLAAVVTPPQQSADSSAWREFRSRTAQLAQRIRQLGTDRVVFASDYSARSINGTADALRTWLPLTPDELQRVFANRAPYLR
jgi:predicted TIM-barrel fold metal-dependent hydrolase